MTRAARKHSCGLVLALGCLGTAAAQAPAPHAREIRVAMGRLTRQLRVGGTTAAARAYTIRIPQIPGQNYQFTLVSIVPSGAQVKQGDLLAQFDATVEIQNALDAKAKYDDLSHQVDDTGAQNRASAEQRSSDLQQAQADLGKAQLELKKAPILGAIDAETDQLNLEDAQAHIASLKRENAFKDQADAAALKILELQRDQQKVEFERAQATAAELTLRAPLGGMVGLVPVWRATGQAPSQPGDQIYTGTAILRIFDPGEMEVVGQINEADGATLAPGLKGVLHLDAYPDARLPVHFESANPVAVTGLAIPVRTFAARFHVDGRDPRLLPDLSAAVDLDVASPVDRVLIPRSSLHFAGGEPYVTKQDRAGHWVEQRVELGNYNDEQVEIISGLAAGDAILAANSGGGGS